MLKIKNRIALIRVLVISRGRINERTARGVGALRIKENLPQLAVRHVLERIKILVMGREFHRAAPALCAEEEQAIGIRNFGAVDLERIIVKTFVQRPRMAVPGAIFAFRKFAAVSEGAAYVFGL